MTNATSKRPENSFKCPKYMRLSTRLKHAEYNSRGYYAGKHLENQDAN